MSYTEDFIGHFAGISLQIRVAIALIVMFFIYLIFRSYNNRLTLPPSTTLYIDDPHNATTVYMNGDLTYLPPMTGSYVQNNMYTYGIWMLINPVSFLTNQWKHVFSRGAEPKAVSPESNIANPALYIHPTINKLRVHLSCLSKNIEIDIDDIQLNKWIHLTMVMEYKQMSIYLNGKQLLTQYVDDTLRDTVNMNHYFNYFGGFYGNIAYFTMSPLVYTQNQVEQLYEYGRPVMEELVSLDNTPVKTPMPITGACILNPTCPTP